MDIAFSRHWPQWLLASVCATAALHVQAAQELHPLAQANGCASCHALQEKLVGPAFASIAKKYSDDKDAAALLVQSIQNGSKGKWGRVPMPPHASLSQQDLKVLANWVLTVKD